MNTEERELLKRELKAEFARIEQQMLAEQEDEEANLKQMRLHMESNMPEAKRWAEKANVHVANIRELIERKYEVRTKLIDLENS